MSNKKRLVCALTTVAVILFMVLSPQYIQRGLERDRYREWTAGEQESFTGIITVWHIVGFKPYKGSLGSWLSSAASKLEAKHGGVFFNVSVMTVEEANALIEQGGKPDVYSFPAGWGYAERFAPLISAPNAAFAGNLADVGRDRGLRAVPYAMSAYCLAADARKLQKLNIALPEVVDGAWINAALEAGATLCGDPAAACLLGVTGAIADAGVFPESGAMLALCDMRVVGDMEVRVANGRGFMTEARPLDMRYSPLVQLIGAADGIREDKLPMVNELIQTLLNEQSQLSLSALGMLPAVQTESIQYQEGFPAAVYKANAGTLSPNVFVYAKYKQALYDEATQALAGDKFSRTSFFQRVNELVPKL